MEEKQYRAIEDHDEGMKLKKSVSSEDYINTQLEKNPYKHREVNLIFWEVERELVPIGVPFSMKYYKQYIILYYSIIICNLK